MNKFLRLDKENILYPVLIIALLCMVILPLLSCHVKKEPNKKGDKYYFGHKYKPQEKQKK